MLVAFLLFNSYNFFMITLPTYNKELLAAHDKIILGVSGGCDSMALLHILYTISKTLPLSLAVAHVNHSLRGKASDKDELFVKKQAERLQLPFFSQKVDIKKLARAKKLSLEDAARISRYTFFQELAKTLVFNKIALAHTLDDQAETIIMKLVRGAGTRGLGGIPELRYLSPVLSIIRPLLGAKKAELKKYCSANKLTWREDLSNKQTDFLRNKVRINILPGLRRLNPNILETLNSMSTTIKEEDRYLDELANNALAKVIQKAVSQGIRIDQKTLNTYPIALQRRIVRLALERVQGSPQDIYLPFVENFLDNKLTTIQVDDRGKLHVSKDRLYY